MTEIFQKIGNFFVSYGWNILFVICLLLICGVVIHFLIAGLKLLLYRTSIDSAVVSFLASLLKIILWILLIFVCAGILELSTSSLVVCLSSIALAIGLALKDSFANLTNGIFILYNHPFRRGNHIGIDGVEGKVQNIKLLSTELITFDNKKLIIPNSKFNNQTITNYSAMATRRVDMCFSVAYGSDLTLVEKVLQDVVSSQTEILKFPSPDIYLSKHNNSSIDYIIRVWVNTEDYWTVYNSIPRTVYDQFEKNNIVIPFNQLDVHIDGSVINKEEQNDKETKK